MSSKLKTSLTRAADMRLAFDRSFAEQSKSDSAQRENILAIRIAGTAHALRSSEIGGMFTDKKVTPIPTSYAALRGIASFRGAILPVYDLHSLLGFPAANSPRWLVTTSIAPVALSFDQFEGYLQISRDAVVPPAAGEARRDHAREFVRTDGDIRAIVDLTSVTAAIKTQISQINS